MFRKSDKDPGGKQRDQAAAVDGQSPLQMPRPLRVVTRRDLHELYLLVKGVRYANTLLDAEVALGAGDVAKTLELVQSMRDVYYQSQLRKLRVDPEKPEGRPKTSPRDVEKIKKKQEKIQLVLAHLDVVLAALQRMVERRGDTPSPKGTRSTRSEHRRLSAHIDPSCVREYRAAANDDEVLEAIRKFYDLRAVETEPDLGPNGLYYLLGSDQSYLIRTPPEEISGETVEIESAIDGKRLNPQRKEKLLELGSRRKLWRLVAKDQAKSSPSTSPETGRTKVGPSKPPEESGIDQAKVNEVLDMGAFSQLLDAAKRSGIVPNADLVGHIRDREFRMGNYQKAFQVIEGLYGKFTAATIQRNQRLRREETDIASGRTKMSPKEIQRKRAKDTADTQKIDRTRNRFTRVMEGLRILMQGGPRKSAATTAESKPSK